MGGDKFYPNGKKMYDGFHKHYYHENGQKAYDGFHGHYYYVNGQKAVDGFHNCVFYKNGQKAYDGFHNRVFYSNGNRMGNEGVVITDGLDMNVQGRTGSFKLSLGPFIHAAVSMENGKLDSNIVFPGTIFF